MSMLLKTFLMLLQIGGGLLGLGLIGRSFLTEELTQIAMIVHAAFFIVFLFGIVAGMALIGDPRLGLFLSLIYQGIQIPTIVSPVVSYTLFCGATFSVYRHATGFGSNLLFGSRYYFYLNSGGPWCAGMNIIALVLFVLLIREIWLEKVALKNREIELSEVPSQGSWRTS